MSVQMVSFSYIRQLLSSHRARRYPVIKVSGLAELATWQIG
nr:MAG TPA: hypothetical protein [Caudoviricetes sp.]